MRVKLEVLDVYGNVISTLVNSDLNASRHSYIWDGSDNRGNKVSNGTYLYRLTADNQVVSGKMTLIK